MAEFEYLALHEDDFGDDFLLDLLVRRSVADYTGGRGRWMQCKARMGKGNNQDSIYKR